MPELAGATHVVRFGVFEVDLRAGELRKKGLRVRLQEQPFQVLAVLLERPGDVVTREELKRRLWPGTVVDFDHGLNTTIKKLRDALGDSADTPRFVETLPRRGYRFVYPVNGEAALAPEGARAPARSGDVATPVNGAAAAPVGEAPPSPPGSVAVPRPRAASRFLVVALPVAALALLALGLGGLRARRAGSPAVSRIGAIAVLPLKGPSAGPDLLADGMTEALVSELGKVGALRVLSYDTAVRYRDSAKPLSEIAREAGVDALVVGTVLRSGARVRITAELVLASPERRLWSRSYDVASEDVLAAQKELARDVAGASGVEVTPREQVRLAVSRRIDSEAYEAYLLARAHLARTPTQESWARTKAYLEQAIRKDPGYAPAHAAMGQLHLRVRGSPTRSAAAARVQARQWVERALELDDTLAAAHATLARIAQQEWDWAGAEREFGRAIELNPSLAEARTRRAMLLTATQRHEEAALEARRAQQLDPLSPFVNTWAGAAYFYAGRDDEARRSLGKVLELDPGYSDASLVLARAHVTRGEHAQAIALLERALGSGERPPLVLGALAHAYARAGRRDAAAMLVDELVRIEANAPGFVPPFGLIWAYAGLGDRDRAFAALERSYEARTDRMAWLAVDPLLEPLRGDPRFADLVRRVGVPGGRSRGPEPAGSSAVGRR